MIFIHVDRRPAIGSSFPCVCRYDRRGRFKDTATELGCPTCTGQPVTPGHRRHLSLTRRWPHVRRFRRGRGHGPHRTAHPCGAIGATVARSRPWAIALDPLDIGDRHRRVLLCLGHKW